MSERSAMTPPDFDKQAEQDICCDCGASSHKRHLRTCNVRFRPTYVARLRAAYDEGLAAAIRWHEEQAAEEEKALDTGFGLAVAHFHRDNAAALTCLKVSRGAG